MYLPVVGHFFTVIVNEGNDKGTYQSNLYNINSHHMFIALPQNENGRVNLTPGTKVVLDYRDSKDIPCRFETVVDVFPDAAQNILALKCPDTIERQQRRENVRVPVGWPVTISNSSETFTAKMNDISGGGLSAWVLSQYGLNAGEQIKLSFEIKIGHEIILLNSDAEVISIQSNGSKDNELLCSIRFTSIDESLRKKIMEYVFDRQILDIALRNSGRSVMF